MVSKCFQQSLRPLTHLRLQPTHPTRTTGIQCRISHDTPVIRGAHRLLVRDIFKNVRFIFSLGTENNFTYILEIVNSRKCTGFESTAYARAHVLPRAIVAAISTSISSTLYLASGRMWDITHNGYPPS